MIFSRIFCLMFLMDIIKHNLEKKFKTCFIFLRDCLGEVSRKRVMLSGGNKNLFKTN